MRLHRLPLDVHRFPQHFTDDETDDPGFPWPDGGPQTWGDRCCGIACLRMLLRFHGLPVPLQRELLREGLATNAYATGVGWTHAGLVALATRHGLAGTAEAVDRSTLQGMAADGIPSIISCTWQLPEDGRQGGHLIVFTGEADRDGDTIAGFADPSRWGAEHSEVPARRFWASWTGRAIMLQPT
ncbi:cysteine peptidase family C39 domain-containing protein [Nocardia vinacea]|uniref:cysteine peptidase family C39 domain-containing protein n=1 Tax=Nocardia vinacea TaxID=96468 RepID=UPI002E105261|nr:cysteine peptidase family C39 domain-containing protein [Nocardia vinacea]